MYVCIYIYICIHIITQYTHIYVHMCKVPRSTEVPQSVVRSAGADHARVPQDVPGRGRDPLNGTA